MLNAIKTYNSIMWDICREYNTIGTSMTEDAETRNKWNLRDLVSEMQYTLDIYKDPDCCYYEEAHDPDASYHKEALKEWKSLTARMKRFIDKYKTEAMTMQCTEGHCSRFD